jgi:hypothetical protein
MFAIVLMDHRLALAALVALLIAAAAPLAYAWTKLLPEERPPFSATAASPPREDLVSSPKSQPKKDPVVIFLLICVTLSYVLQFPGLPPSSVMQWLSTLLPADYFSPTVLTGRWFFLVVPGIAVAYSALRPNPMRIALILGGLLVLALWLVSPILLAAIATA